MKTMISMLAVLLLAVAFAGCESVSSDEATSWGSSSSGHNHAGMNM